MLDVEEKVSLSSVPSLHISLSAHYNIKFGGGMPGICFLTVRLSAFVSSVGRHPAAADLSAVQISQSGGALTGDQWTQAVSLCVTVCRYQNVTEQVAFSSCSALCIVRWIKSQLNPISVWEIYLKKDVNQFFTCKSKTVSSTYNVMFGL